MASNYREGETPVPIPNTEVKPLFADDSMRVAACECRALLDLKKSPVGKLTGDFSFYLPQSFPTGDFFKFSRVLPYVGADLCVRPLMFRFCTCLNVG